jgi:DNA helicase HerA-like ATPase
LKDTVVLVCKTRGSLEADKLHFNVPRLPSRTGSKISYASIQKLAKLNGGSRPVVIGRTNADCKLVIDAKLLDGRLNIIAGRKGTGKSHLTKLLVCSLIKYNAPCVVFDVNGEYVNLSSVDDAHEGPKASSRVNVLVPGRNLKLSLRGVGLRATMDMLIHALDLPGTSSRIFSRIWNGLEKEGKLSLETLIETVTRTNCNEAVKDAIIARCNTLLDSGMFSERLEETIDYGQLVSKIRDGGAIVLNMKDLTTTTRRMLVELTLGKLAELLSTWKLRAAFLFAEEAHLYLRDTYWDDIVTRMRHLGLFTTFVTNQPDTIRDGIYRQADNMFLFNFVNEHDLDAIARASRIDSESIRYITRELPIQHCLVIGDVVKNLPIVVDVRPLEFHAMGETRYYFQD